MISRLGLINEAQVSCMTTVLEVALGALSKPTFWKAHVEDIVKRAWHFDDACEPTSMLANASWGHRVEATLFMGDHGHKSCVL